MAFYYILLIAFVQGITEFLPISSSAHLVLLPKFVGVEDQGLVIDVASHFGTMLAVCLYFFKDVWQLVLGGVECLKLNFYSEKASLFLSLVVATLPVIIAGFVIHQYFGDTFRTLFVIAIGTIIFGILLYIADRYFMNVKKMHHMNFRDAFLIGIAQAFSLFPGASRSGVTMTMGRFLGYERHAAAHFSLLLSIPTILGSATLITIDIIKAGDFQLTMDAIWVAFISALVAYYTIAFLTNWVKKSSFTIFVIYRLLLGAGLLYYIYA